MSLRIVQSKQNPRLKELRRALSQPPRLAEPDTLLGLEGLHLVEEALRAGLNIHAVFVAEGYEHMLDELARKYSLLTDLETFVVPREILNAAQSTESPQPVAALVEPPVWKLDALVEGSGPVVVLAGLQDPGNLGTILRSAEAFAAAGVILLPGTVSPWNPKVLRSSAGSAFRIPMVTTEAAAAIDFLRKAGRKIFTTAVEGATPLTQLNLTVSHAYLIGNEGNGVPAEIAALADAAITIPTGAVESLNAAIATSILLYESAWQRARAPQRTGAKS